MDEMPFVSQIDIETELQEMARVYNGDWSAVDDLKISFNQVELAAQVQPYFGFQDSAGRSFVSTVMVMGNRSSPETMDDLTKVVAGCKGYAKISAGGSCDTHIDNIRYVGDFDTCVSDCTLLHRNSSACNVQLNGGDFAVPCQANEFCGKFNNYATKTVRLADKQIPKLSAARDQLLRQDATVGDLEEIFGKLQWASVVLQAPTHNFYFAIKFVRRRLSALAKGVLSRDSACHLWALARRDFEAWFHFLLQNNPVHPQRVLSSKDCSFVLFSDASNKGWGAVLTSPTTGLIESIGSVWPDQLQFLKIADKEALALKYGLEHFHDKVQGGHLAICVDNTSLQGALRKGRYGAPRLNAEVGEILKALPVASQFALHYVDTKSNPADYPSRNRDSPPHECVVATTDYVQRGDWRRGNEVSIAHVVLAPQDVVG